MELLHLVIRTLSFAASLWILLEFIATCNVSSASAYVLVGTVCVATIFIFIATKQNRMFKCDHCNQAVLKKLI